jgi:hypothetical protein
MIIEDFVMLGRTVPEQSKKHGLVVCSAGYSKELRQFMRIYPISMFDNIPRWSLCRIALRRNTSDSRIESWRLLEPEHIDIVGQTTKADEFDYLSRCATDSIATLNNERKSLGIIAPSVSGRRFDKMEPNEEFMLDLFPDETADRRLPRVIFNDSVGRHDLQVRDWGAHEFLRKNPKEDHYKLWSALKFDAPEYDRLFFVGNHNQHRTSWLVISVISEKTKPQMILDF